MPIYDYKCKKGHITEALRSRDEKQITCPVCQSIAQRQISLPSMIKIFPIITPITAADVNAINPEIARKT